MATNQTPPSECITIEQRLHKHVPPTQPQSNITTNTTNTVNDTNSNINPIPNVITILPRSTEQPRSSPAFEEQTNTRPPAIEEPNINNGNGSSNNGNGSSNNGNNDTDAGSSSSSRNSVAISTKKAVLKGVGGNIKSEFKAKTTKSTITSQKKEEIAANMKKFMSQNELKELCVKVGISQSTTGGKDRMIERIMAKTNELEGAAAAIASAIEVVINKRKKEEVEAGEKKRKIDEDKEAKRIEKAEKKEKKEKRDAEKKEKKRKRDEAKEAKDAKSNAKKVENDKNKNNKMYTQERTSNNSNVTDKMLYDAIQNSSNGAEALRKVGLSVCGTNYKRINRLKASTTSHVVENDRQQQQHNTTLMAAIAKTMAKTAARTVKEQAEKKEKSEFKAKTTKSTITSQKKEEIAANMKKFMSQKELQEWCVKVEVAQSIGNKDRMIECIMAKTNELEGAVAAIASAIEVAINKRKKEEVEAGEKKRKRDEDEEAKRIEKAEKKEKKRKRDEDEDAKRKAKKAKYDSAASVAQREKDRKKLEAAQLSPHCSGDLSNGTTATMSFNGDNDVTYFDNHDYRTAKWMQVNTLLHLGTIDAHPHIQLLYNNEDVRTNQSNTIEKRSLSSTAMDEIVLLCRRSGTVPSLHIKPALTETDKQKGLFESPGRKLVLEAIKRYAVRLRTNVYTEVHIDFEGNSESPNDACLYSGDTNQKPIFSSQPGKRMDKDQRKQLHEKIEELERNGNKLLRKSGREQDLIDNLLKEFSSTMKIDIQNTDTAIYYVFGRLGNGVWKNNVYSEEHPVQSCSMSYLTALILRRLFRHGAEPDAKDQAEIWNAVIGALFRFYVSIGEINATTGELISM